VGPWQCLHVTPHPCHQHSLPPSIHNVTGPIFLVTLIHTGSRVNGSMPIKDTLSAEQQAQPRGSALSPLITSPLHTLARKGRHMQGLTQTWSCHKQGGHAGPQSQTHEHRLAVEGGHDRGGGRDGIGS
jgi:hypothetical protein